VFVHRATVATMTPMAAGEDRTILEVLASLEDERT
jgi:hypothetical protein